MRSIANFTILMVIIFILTGGTAAGSPPQAPGLEEDRPQPLDCESRPRRQVGESDEGFSEKRNEWCQKCESELSEVHKAYCEKHKPEADK